jgi:hypothetical protein
LVEQRTENPRVGGSIPPLATIPAKSIGYHPRGPLNPAPTIGLLIRLPTVTELETVTVMDKARPWVYVRQIEILEAGAD